MLSSMRLPFIQHFLSSIFSDASLVVLFYQSRCRKHFKAHPEILNKSFPDSERPDPPLIFQILPDPLFLL